jgi:amino acid transporter
MSITAMVHNEVLKSQGRPPATSTRTRRAGRAHDNSSAEGSGTAAGDVIAALVSYVPAEAIAAYLVLLPFMDPSSNDRSGTRGPSQLVGHESYTGRWWLATAITVLAVLYAIGYRKLQAVQIDEAFAMPWIPIATTILGFSAWVFAIPDSPFADFSFYTPQLGGAAGSIVATAISFVGAVTGETLTYAKARSGD